VRGHTLIPGQVTLFFFFLGNPLPSILKILVRVLKYLTVKKVHGPFVNRIANG
jgi:hypothetical protein